MNSLALGLTLLIALLQILFMLLEMFFWHRGLGLKIFHQSYEKAYSTRILAMNQGFYNGILAVGILWGLWLGPSGESMLIFLLASVLAAGLFGGFTASRGILWVQALPAALALAATLAR